MEMNEDGTIDALTMGRTASFYYLKHDSMHVFSRGLRAGMGVPEVGTCLHALLAAHPKGPQCSLSACSVSFPALARGPSSQEAFRSLSCVQSGTAHPIWLTWQVLDVLCAVAEYNELPVRHNEDKLNMALSEGVRFPIRERDADDPHAKAKLLLQVRIPRPNPSMSVLDTVKSICSQCLAYALVGITFTLMLSLTCSLYYESCILVEVHMGLLREYVRAW